MYRLIRIIVGNYELLELESSIVIGKAVKESTVSGLITVAVNNFAC
jgi:hypothetical protein